MKKSILFIICYFIYMSIGFADLNSVDPIIDTSDFTSNNSGIFKQIKDFEVNYPIKIIFPKNIETSSVSNSTFYMLDNNASKLKARIIVNNNIVCLISQQMMKPDSNYSLMFNNIKSIDGDIYPSSTVYITTKKLDFGLYWFGKNDESEKYIPLVNNNFYDLNKPTVIYVHGWKQEAVERNYERETFYFKEPENNDEIYTNNFWIDEGWNTGILYWNQFCEESEIKDSEAKIWTFNGPKGARYKMKDGTYNDFNKKIQIEDKEITVDSVGQALFHYVFASLKNNNSGNIRIIGHSIGSQIACLLANMLKDNEIYVNRLALLDPIWTKGGKEYLNDINHDNEPDTVANRCFWYVMKLTNSSDFAVELYNSSLIDIGVVGDNNDDLRKIVAETSIRPWYYNINEIENKHNVVRHHYMWSFAYEPPVECTLNTLNKRTPTGKVAASAKTSNQRIREMMSLPNYWDQVEGRYTTSPEDDWFELKSGTEFESKLGEFSGNVQSYITGNMESIPGVKVTILENGKTAISDSQGNFIFSNVSYGVYTLKFEKSPFIVEQLPFVVVNPGKISNIIPFTLNFPECNCNMPGDTTMDNRINIKDSIYAIKSAADMIK